MIRNSNAPNATLNSTKTNFILSNDGNLHNPYRDNHRYYRCHFFQRYFIQEKMMNHLAKTILLAFKKGYLPPMADKPDYNDDEIEHIEESIGFKPEVPMPGPMPPKPFDPDDLTDEEKIKVFHSLFTYHPGQHVRNLLNERGYVHMVGVNLNGVRLYGVIYEKHKLVFSTAIELKPIGFQKDVEDKPLSKERKTDIDESIHKGIQKHHKNKQP